MKICPLELQLLKTYIIDKQQNDQADTVKVKNSNADV